MAFFMAGTTRTRKKGDCKMKPKIGVTFAFGLDWPDTAVSLFLRSDLTTDKLMASQTHLRGDSKNFPFSPYFHPQRESISLESRVLYTQSLGMSHSTQTTGSWSALLRPSQKEPPNLASFLPCLTAQNAFSPLSVQPPTRTNLPLLAGTTLKPHPAQTQLA